MDLVEVAPAYDHADVTALAAASLTLDYLCLRALRAGPRRESSGEGPPMKTSR